MSRRAELIQKVLDAALDEMRVALPGIVEKVDIAAQTVDVRPMLIHRLVDDGGGVTQEELPLLPSVPIEWQSAGGFFITMPIAKGDTGLLVFCDWPIDQWLQRGGAAPVDPLDIRAHSLTSATFSPGLRDSKNPIADAHAENMVLGKDGGSQIHIKPNGEVHLTAEAAAQFIALAQKVLDELTVAKTDRDSMKTVFDAHFHVTTATVSAGAPGVIAPPATPFSPQTTPSSVASSKVKAD